jgi:hypothetical protein
MSKFLKSLTDEQLEMLKSEVTSEFERRFNEDVEIMVTDSIKEAQQFNAQARRDEIVEQAKQDIKKIERVGRSYLTPGDTGNYTYRHRVFYVEFVVNRKKRTVVALVRDARTGEVRERGKAKCAPDDCFNVHIGKAIALRRALGLDVPDEYLNAPQPTEVRVGDIVKSKRTGRVCKVIRFCEDVIRDTTWGRPFYTDGVYGWLGTEQVNVIDDSRDDGEV